MNKKNNEFCDIIVSDFKLYSQSYIYFQTNSLRKVMNLLILPSYELNSATCVFCKDGFGIKETHKSINLHGLFNAIKRMKSKKRKSNLVMIHKFFILVKK